jgi:hypothetical protein
MSLDRKEKWLIEYAVHHATEAVVIDGHAVIIISERKYRVLKFFMDTQTFFFYPGVSECGVEHFAVAFGELRYCIGRWNAKLGKPKEAV